MDIKTEIPDTDDDYLKQQTSLESVESKPEARNGVVRTYVIRPLDASRASLKRSLQDRDGSLTVKSECIDVESGKILRESPQTRSVVSTASISEGGAKFWRTASGKLLRLDPASPHPLIVRDSIGELASSKPRLVRLANGRLARITKKRIPASLLHQRTASLANSNQFDASIQRFPVPSARATVAVSDAIDASTLMGNSVESTELFEVQKKEPTPAIKAEPVDEKELEEQQEQSSLPPPTSEALNTLRPSLAAALCDVNTAPTNVSDLVKIVDEPLFNPTRYNNNSSSDHCNVCKKVLPGMKRHLITVEARLTCLVDAVQHLIVQMNPKDLEAAQAAAKAASAIQAASSNPQEHSRCCSSYRAKEANSISESRKSTQERPPSSKLTIPRPKLDNQSGPIRTNPTQAVKRPSILRPGIVRIIRTTPTSSSDAVQPGSVTASPRFVLGKTRFVVADRAQASRTVFAGQNEVAGSRLKIVTLKSEAGAKDATN